MNRVLFIGNFLSRQRGTIGPMEGVMIRLNKDVIVEKASVYDNKIIKLADMLLKSLFCNYDIIHIDTYSTGALRFADVCASIGKLRRKKVILNLHGGGLYRLYENSKKKHIRNLFLKATTIVSPSMYLQDMFSKEGFAIQYLPNMIDDRHFPYNAVSIDNNKLLWVRAFNSTYQPWLAVKTLFEVRKKYLNATLTMIGPDKGLLAETKKLIEQLDLNKSVEIVGKIPNTELWRYYTTHSVYLNTTDTESFGVAVMEAASCGIPIVTTSVGELPYLWNNNEDALLIESFNERDFANNVIRLFEDKILVEKLKTNARGKAESFGWEVVKKHWLNLLK